MNFPMTNPLFESVYWLINTAGLGGIVVLIVGGGSLMAYGLILAWVSLGHAPALVVPRPRARVASRARTQTPEEAVYLYPTSALHGHIEHAPEPVAPGHRPRKGRISNLRER